MEKYLVCETGSRKTVFEPKPVQNPNNQLIQAKDWLNDRTLRTGAFSQAAFNSDLCRAANKEEISDYQVLKDHSKFALNATE